MPKVILSADERYPDYSVHTDGRYGDYEVHATDEQMQRWKAAAEAYEATQREMDELYHAAADAHRERATQATAEREAAEKAAREERQAQAAAEAKERAQAAAWRALKESGGIVYDANGNPIARIEPADGVRNVGRVIPMEDL